MTTISTLTIKLEARQIGRKNALVPSWNLELTDLPEPLTLKALLERIVRSEVEKYNQRQSDSKFVRALTQTDLETAAETGKISLGGRETEARHADAGEAIETAMLAFQLRQDEERKRTSRARAKARLILKHQPNPATLDCILFQQGFQHFRKFFFQAS